MAPSRGFGILEGVTANHIFIPEIVLEVKKCYGSLGIKPSLPSLLQGPRVCPLLFCVLLVDGTVSVILFSKTRLQQAWTLIGLPQMSARGEKPEEPSLKQHFRTFLDYFLSPFDFLFPKTRSWEELEEQLLTFTAPSCPQEKKPLSSFAGRLC